MLKVKGSGFLHRTKGKAEISRSAFGMAESRTLDNGSIYDSFLYKSRLILSYKRYKKTYSVILFGQVADKKCFWLLLAYQK